MRFVFVNMTSLWVQLQSNYNSLKSELRKCLISNFETQQDSTETSISLTTAVSELKITGSISSPLQLPLWNCSCTILRQMSICQTHHKIFIVSTQAGQQYLQQHAAESLIPNFQKQQIDTVPLTSIQLWMLNTKKTDHKRNSEQTKATTFSFPISCLV